MQDPALKSLLKGGPAHTLALSEAQLTEIALGPAMVRWICEGSSPVVLSAAIPLVRDRKSVAGLREESHGCVYGGCTQLQPSAISLTQARQGHRCIKGRSEGWSAGMGMQAAQGICNEQPCCPLCKAEEAMPAYRAPLCNA